MFNVRYQFGKEIDFIQLQLALLVWWLAELPPTVSSGSCLKNGGPHPVYYLKVTAASVQALKTNGIGKSCTLFKQYLFDI